MANLTPLSFGPWTSLSGLVVGATSGTTSGYVSALNSPATTITVQTNVSGTFSGAVNVQLIGSLDGVNFYTLTSGNAASSSLTQTSLSGPIFFVGTQLTNASGAGNASTSITTYVWSK